MLSTNWLLNKLAADFPSLHFETGDDFKWSFTTRTIVVNPHDKYFYERTLHEVSHAVLQHSSYDTDIDLIAMERDAWHQAKTKLGSTYGITIAADTIEDDLDTYRNWLHARSTCPSCNATGLQVKKQEYRCVSCAHRWRVNEARICSLRRYSIKK